MTESHTGDGQGAAAGGHPATVQTALAILDQGGNAIDAGVAAVFSACVAEPILTGPLGAGMLAYQPADGDPAMLDFFATVPGLERDQGDTSGIDFVAVGVDFGPTTQEFHVGRGSAAVPGTVAGLFAAHQRWGKLPMEQLVQPACRLATQGVQISARMAQMFRFLEPILRFTPESEALFAPHGRLLGSGDRFINPQLAETLQTIAHKGLSWVHEGALAERIVETFGGPDGLLSHRDLAAFEPCFREPLSLRFGSATVLLPPPPAAGGPLVAHSLQQLDETLQPGDDPALSWYGRLAASMRETAQAREGLLNQMGSTTHVSVIDGEGNAVAITTSNGESCGVLVPDTGIVMNNFLGEADINPKGFHQQPAGERMLTMMCPTIVREQSGTITVLGTGGSNRIRTAIFQVVANLVARGMPLEEAIIAPRMHLEDGSLHFEQEGMEEAVTRALGESFETLIPFPKRNMFFGGVHAVRKSGDAITGAGDPRRGGVFQRQQAS